jgi:carboxynorspermidine decarboxylase
MKTPYYFIQEKKLLENLKKIEIVRKLSGAKVLLALKCFSIWPVFPLMRKYMDGTTSSSPYEVRLGYEEFGGETHGFSVGYTKDDILEIRKYSDKIIFNSISQLEQFQSLVKDKSLGLRINPDISYSDYVLADPNKKYSRLGARDRKEIKRILPLINGAMFHCNCDNDDFGAFDMQLKYIESEYASILEKLDWVSLGGGMLFTKEKYPIEKFAIRLKEFSETFNVQVYLEPGEAVIADSASLVTSVVDIVKNRVSIAIIDASTEAHMLDLLTYRVPAKIKTSGKYRYMIAGRSCLAGDEFGIHTFPSKLKVGDIIRIDNAAGYSMVKMNWFNGLQMPSIVVERLNGTIEPVRVFIYEDFKNNISIKLRGGSSCKTSLS